MSDKLNALKALIRRFHRAVVAFSGGADSAFVLRVCSDTIGNRNVIAVTAQSETYTAAELEYAKDFARETGVEHAVLATEELGDERFSENSPVRCYYCKLHFYEKVRAFADARGIRAIFDGSNRDDEKDHRPGRNAAKERGVISPLIETGFTKSDVREHSKAMGLPTWNRPSNPCLASRVPYGQRITKEKLAAIEKAESFLRCNGFRIVRVRHHDSIARIELDPGEMPRFFTDSLHQKTSEYFKDLGFAYAALDICGYRTGSMNEVLGDRT